MHCPSTGDVVSPTDGRFLKAIRQAGKVETGRVRGRVSLGIEHSDNPKLCSVTGRSGLAGAMVDYSARLRRNYVEIVWRARAMDGT